ncbi:MAG: hypothetical protein ABIG71_03525 [Candidatus Uhrbacteria bacterium]
MDQALLNRLLDLVAKTGDRVVVVDPLTRRPFVLMGLEQYEALQRPIADERMAPFTQSVVDEHRVDSDIDIWRASQEAALSDAPAVSGDADSFHRFVPEPMHAAVADDDRFYVEPLE